MTYKEQFADAEKAKHIRSLSPVWVKFEKPGDVVLGVLLGTSEVTSGLGSGTYLQYLMQTDEGLIKFSLGAATDRELSAVLKNGMLVRITYVEQVKIKGGRRVNRFTAEIAEAAAEGEVASDDVPF